MNDGASMLGATAHETFPSCHDNRVAASPHLAATDAANRPCYDPGHARSRREVPLQGGDPRAGQRSEEHTSELQSHVNLVCRLLLEKKNKIITHKQTQI